MRRIYGALVLALLLQLAAPGPALGWWENIEPWSGPGWWKGFDIDARLFCLVDNIPSVRKDALVARMQKNAARPAFTPLPSQVPGQVEAQRGLVKAVNTEVGQWKATLDEWESILNEWQRYAGLAGDRVAAVRQPLADVRARADTSLDRIDPATEAWIASTGARSVADEAIRRAQQDATRAADGIQRATETIRRIVDQPRMVPSALPGVLYSACRLQQEERRRAAFDIGMRFVWTHDDRYADGERINFTTIEPAFSWNVFSNPSYDVVEYGLGAGFYWVSSKAFPSFTGGFLEPIRLDFHFPTRFVSNETMTRKIIRSVVFRAGYLVFPGGFEPDAFLADPLNPETHRRISRDWVRYYGIYVDTEVFRKKS